MCKHVLEVEVLESECRTNSILVTIWQCHLYLCCCVVCYVPSIPAGNDLILRIGRFTTIFSCTARDLHQIEYPESEGYKQSRMRAALCFLDRRCLWQGGASASFEVRQWFGARSRQAVRSLPFGSERIRSFL
jgi:hypothetical protein